MKTLLYTGHDAAYSTLADITVPRMESYAMKHGMDFMCFTEPLIDVPNGIYWTGVCGALQAFEKGYERAIYLDVDQLVTNFDKPIYGANCRSCQRGFHASKDWGDDAIDPWHFSMCGFVAYRSAELLFRTALEMEPEWRDKPFPEQGPVQDVVRRMLADLPHMVPNKEGYTGLINIHPRKIFNCVPDQVCPGKVPEPWEPGDWCAHLTMLGLEDRVRLANEILSSL